MRIVMVVPNRLPAAAYGGTERVVWWLGKELAARGHEVVLLAEAGSRCEFAEVQVRNPRIGIEEQISRRADVVHFHYPYSGGLSTPYLVTVHINSREGRRFDRNAVFLSRNHALRHGSETFVYNGLDPAEFGRPGLEERRDYFHFLGKAAWRVKNVRGAIRIAQQAGVRLKVLGGHRFNFKMGFRFTLDPRISFAGMVGGERKNAWLRGSRGLILPVLWQEPFGLAIIESLYFGCPVVATPYGSLPELVPASVGVLSKRVDDLVEAVRNIEAFDRVACHEWVTDNFTARAMTDGYLQLYERVLGGEALNREVPVARPDGECTLE